MTVLLQGFEGATPSLTDLTVGNTGGGTSTAFDAVVRDGTSVLRSNDAHAAAGSLGAELSAGISEAAYGEWSTAMGTKTTFFSRAYYWFDALPTGATRIFQALNGAGSTFSVQIGTAGKPAMLDAAGGTIATMSSAGVIALGQLIRIEWTCVCSATVGTAECRLFNSSGSTTATEIITGTALNTNTQATKYRFGRAASAATATGTSYLDAIELNDTGWAGPISSAPGVTRPRRRGNGMVAVMEAIR